MLKPRTVNNISFIRLAVVITIFWIVFFVAGLLALILFTGDSSTSANWIKTDSIISEIKDTTTYVAYDAKDKNGNEYHYDHQQLNEYRSVWNIGDTVPIKYNPDKPSEIVSNTMAGEAVAYIVSITFMCVGVVGATVTVIKALKQKRSVEEREEFDAKSELAMSRQVPEFPDDNSISGKERNTATNNTNSHTQLVGNLQDGEEIFLMRSSSSFANKIYNYVVTDLYGKEILTSRKTNKAIIGTAKISIYNHLTNETVEHAFGGAVITSSYKDTYCFKTNRYVNVDKRRCWELYKEWGIYIDVDDMGTALVYKNDALIGRIKKDSPAVNRMSFKSAIQNYAMSGSYQLICKKEDINDVFLIAFTFAFVLFMTR